ncbi:MAG: phosphatidylglycerol lysyltransferase [Treponema sp.]|jgi:phosphoglucomutase|nr:phosphatidylglycerol lysyltransferase [Treponema sp.]
MLFKDEKPEIREKILDKALNGMILSASGWRGIFAESGDGEDTTESVSDAHLLIAAGAAAVFAAYLKETSPGPAPLAIVGTDTRPTGKAIADVVIRVLLSSGCTVRFVSVSASPEIMAYARSFTLAEVAGSGVAEDEARGASTTGFIYISASHNPAGYNGFKFGLTDGGVLPAEETAKIIEKFRARMASPARIAEISSLIETADPEKAKKVYENSAAVKTEALSAYFDFTAAVVYGSNAGVRDAIRSGLTQKKLGIAADFNGSARTLSIDRKFFSGLGISLRAINDRSGEIAHRIVPEGDSLEPCRIFLEKLHAEDPSFLLGYVPDCDGDRGNLVVWDEGEKRGRSLEAQEVFALACMAELAHLVWTGELAYDNKGNALTKAAIAVNDPTSMRIDRIARAFDVSVFRAEVGEANVVGLARKLREKGYTVRILGEGSAGGTITHPSAVRDPLDTVFALVKLLTIRSVDGRRGLFELWCDLSGQAEIYHPDFTLSDIIASLPAFVTTGAYSPEALLQIKSADHGALKNRYQEIFLRDWEERKDRIKSHYEVTGWEAAAYNGAEERRGITRFGDAGRGGLKINFLKNSGYPAASIWMRGSATEPVFRIMADAEGSDKRIEKDLIEWQRRMVVEADDSINFID